MNNYIVYWLPPSQWLAPKACLIVNVEDDMAARLAFLGLYNGRLSKMNILSVRKIASR